MSQYTTDDVLLENAQDIETTMSGKLLQENINVYALLPNCK